MSDEMKAELVEDEGGNAAIIGTDAEGSRRLFTGLEVVSFTTKSGGPDELIRLGPKASVTGEIVVPWSYPFLLHDEEPDPAPP